MKPFKAGLRVGTQGPATNFRRNDSTALAREGDGEGATTAIAMARREKELLLHGRRTCWMCTAHTDLRIFGATVATTDPAGGQVQDGGFALPRAAGAPRTTPEARGEARWGRLGSAPIPPPFGWTGTVCPLLRGSTHRELGRIPNPDVWTGLPWKGDVEFSATYKKISLSIFLPDNVRQESRGWAGRHDPRSHKRLS